MKFSVEVSLNAESFKTFAYFNYFKRLKSHVRPVIFALFMAVCAVIAFSQYHVSGAMLLGGVLLLIGLLLPFSFFKSISKAVQNQIKVLRISEERHVYTIEIDEKMLHILVGKNELSFPWEDIHAVYGYKGNLYIYVNPEQAFIILKEQCDVEQLKASIVQNTNVKIVNY